MMLKRGIALFAALLVALSLTACGKTAPAEPNTQAPANTTGDPTTGDSTTTDSAKPDAAKPDAKDETKTDAKTDATQAKTVEGVVNRLEGNLVLLVDGTYYVFTADGALLKGLTQGDKVTVTYTGTLESESQDLVATAIAKK